MNASSFITFSTYMLQQNIIPFWKKLFVNIAVSFSLRFALNMLIRGSLMKPKWQKLASLAQEICTL